MSCDELAGRAHFQPSVRVVVVVVLNSASDQSKNSLGVRQQRHLDVVALQRLHEGLGDAIALRALDRREAGLQAKLAGEDLGVLRDVGRAIIGQHLDNRRRAVWTCPMPRG